MCWSVWCVCVCVCVRGAGESNTARRPPPADDGQSYHTPRYSPPRAAAGAGRRRRGRAAWLAPCARAARPGRARGACARARAATAACGVGGDESREGALGCWSRRGPSPCRLDGRFNAHTRAATRDESRNSASAARWHTHTQQQQHTWASSSLGDAARKGCRKSSSESSAASSDANCCVCSARSAKRSALAIICSCARCCYVCRTASHPRCGAIASMALFAASTFVCVGVVCYGGVGLLLRRAHTAPTDFALQRSLTHTRNGTRQTRCSAFIETASARA